MPTSRNAHGNMWAVMVILFETHLFSYVKGRKCAFLVASCTPVYILPDVLLRK